MRGIDPSATKGRRWLGLRLTLWFVQAPRVWRDGCMRRIVVQRIHNRNEKKLKRVELRNSGTAAETTLWKHLQRRQLEGKNFRRQHGIGPYIVDFYCPECRLIVELDGQPHYEFIADVYEAERTKYFSQFGIKVVRFENRLVFEALEAVLATIRRELLPAQPDQTVVELPFF